MFDVDRLDYCRNCAVRRDPGHAAEINRAFPEETWRLRGIRSQPSRPALTGQSRTGQLRRRAAEQDGNRRAQRRRDMQQDRCRSSAGLGRASIRPSIPSTTCDRPSCGLQLRIPAFASARQGGPRDSISGYCDVAGAAEVGPAALGALLNLAGGGSRNRSAGQRLAGPYSRQGLRRTRRSAGRVQSEPARLPHGRWRHLESGPQRLKFAGRRRGEGIRTVSLRRGGAGGAERPWINSLISPGDRLCILTAPARGGTASFNSNRAMAANSRRGGDAAQPDFEGQARRIGKTSAKSKLPARFCDDEYRLRRHEAECFIHRVFPAESRKLSQIKVTVRKPQQHRRRHHPRPTNSPAHQNPASSRGKTGCYRERVSRRSGANARSEIVKIIPQSAIAPACTLGTFNKPIKTGGVQPL